VNTILQHRTDHTTDTHTWGPCWLIFRQRTKSELCLSSCLLDPALRERFVFCHAANAAGLSQVVLLKHLEKTTADLFETHKTFEDARHTLGAEPEHVRSDAVPQADA
jgi:hypothetical protein